MVSMSISSEYAFHWNGPRSLLTWACQILVLLIFSLLTCFECIFCGRWRDLLPYEPPDYEAIERRARKLRHEMVPEPLPAIRPRALTIPLQVASVVGKAPGADGGSYVHESDIAPTGQVTHHQSQSFFCAKFPAEVRLMVYEHVISGYGQSDVFHILAKKKRLGLWRCRRPKDGRPCDWSGPCCSEWIMYRYRWKWALQAGNVREWEDALVTDGGLLPLVMSCRMM
jgi:hypothetical protein